MLHTVHATIARLQCEKCNHFSFSRSPGEFWEAYDSSEMKLNPDVAENVLNRKEVNYKKIKHMNEGEWKSSVMEAAVKTALDFTEVCSNEIEFSLPMIVVER